jgi:alkylation response protein AidB-like acyl-CoA dehydrogenase
MAVRHAATAAQQAELLGPMVEGRTSLALAWAERQGRYDACDVSTRAERRGGGYALSGEKVWVLNGHAADELIVSARTEGARRDAAGVSLFRVRGGARGVERRAVPTMDGGRAALVRFEGAEAERLGDAADADRGGAGDTAGASALEVALDKGGAAACAEGLGVVSRVLWMTVEYLKTRKQFGVPIGVFQALQHRAVDMFVQVELCKGTSILANAGAESPSQEERARAVSAGLVQLAQGGFFVVAQATQLHGGIGVTDEHDVSLYFKRLRALLAAHGDEQHHVARFMRLPSFDAGVRAT